MRRRIKGMTRRVDEWQRLLECTGKHEIETADLLSCDESYLQYRS